ncbi:hypothetical protein HZS_3547 [Henneguya salminicola]|nr:hypothetical protein HZS_3547 [Henneguya salminicola]
MISRLLTRQLLAGLGSAETCVFLFSKEIDESIIVKREECFVSNGCLEVFRVDWWMGIENFSSSSLTKGLKNF